MADPTDPTTVGAYTPPTTVDEAQIHDTMVQSMQAAIPEWDEVPGALDDELLWASATVTAETRAELQTNLQSYVLDLLGTMFHVPRQDAVSATGTLTITADDMAGHTIDAGSSAFLGDIELQTFEDLVIDSGATFANVTVFAVDPGASVNGAMGDVTMDPESWISSVVLDTGLTGGVDEEDDAIYQERLRATLTTLATAEILPQDFAILATETDGIEIAWGIDGYNPGDGTSDNVATVAVIAAAADGTAPSDDTLDAAQTALAARTLLCSQVFVVAPTYTSVNVVASVIAKDGWDHTDVQTQVEAVIDSATSPAVYAAPALNVLPLPPPVKLYATDIVGDILSPTTGVPGVEHVVSVTVNSGASVTFDTGELPQTGTKTVTVS